MRLVLVLVLFGSTLCAAPILFRFSATVTGVDAPLAGAFVVGQTVTGVYRFDSTAADASLNAETGVYFNAGDLFSMSLAGSTYAGSTVDIDITNSAAVDIYRVTGSALSGPAVAGRMPLFAVLALTDNAGPVNALASDALPLTAPVLALFNVGHVTLVFDGPGSVANVQAAIDALSAVPEPGTVGMIGWAAALLAVRLVGRRVKDNAG